ncbi:YbgF trimerization domain-containing protein [Sphingosinicella sp. CPCC 101087]|uniref:YbgF trimerization domain-containing protein n=1 Tax=Sphingosinicella sp. CPCC 101087 TaxID=2497754 RepID=UPI00101D3406|nr:tetratricopeptide repeat protein [Sphingosinicella sp. CPCC 101087]
MRSLLIGLVLLAGASSPALAQRADPVERRVDRLEQEMRAVQRRVFPNGRAQFVEPEIVPETGAPARPNLSGDAMSSLSARVDALETQLRTLTGQVEEQGYRTRQLEEQIARLRTDLEGRMDRIEQSSRPAAGALTAPPLSSGTEPAEEEATGEDPADAAPAGTPPAAAADDAEAAYNAGFRLWDSGQFAQAQESLGAAAERFPDSPWASWMRNLQGRAFLDDGKPASAARIFLANYQDNPRGARAADSLFFLGQALTRLNRKPEACRVYGELEQVYPNMRDFLRQRLPQARADAEC